MISSSCPFSFGLTLHTSRQKEKTASILPTCFLPFLSTQLTFPVSHLLLSTVHAAPVSYGAAGFENICVYRKRNRMPYIHVKSSRRYFGHYVEDASCILISHSDLFLAWPLTTTTTASLSPYSLLLCIAFHAVPFPSLHPTVTTNFLTPNLNNSAQKFSQVFFHWISFYVHPCMHPHKRREHEGVKKKKKGISQRKSLWLWMCVCAGWLLLRSQGKQQDVWKCRAEGGMDFVVNGWWSVNAK